MWRDHSSNRDASSAARRLALLAPVLVGLVVLAGCTSTTTSPPGPSTSTSATGLTAYVTNSQDNGQTKGMGSVIPVNLTDQVPGTPIAMGEGTGPNDIVVTADGTTAYVTNEYTGTGPVSISLL